jgi:hypothetical protein
MNIWMAPADGSEEPRQLTALEGLVHFDSFSPGLTAVTFL